MFLGILGAHVVQWALINRRRQMLPMLLCRPVSTNVEHDGPRVSVSLPEDIFSDGA